MGGWGTLTPNHLILKPFYTAVLSILALNEYFPKMFMWKVVCFRTFVSIMAIIALSDS